MTIYDYINEVRLSVNQENSEHLTDEKIVTFLKRGVRDALAITSLKFDNFLYKTLSITTSSDIINIPLECQSYRIKCIRVYNSSGNWWDLDEKAVEDLSGLKNLQPTIPRYYVILHKEIQLFACPDKAYTFEVTYSKRTKDLDLPFGKITNVIGDKLYVDSIHVTNSEGTVILNTNQYISITNGITGENVYNFRVKSYDTGLQYIEIFKGVTGYPLANIDATNKYFQFTIVCSMSNIISGDILTITGSNGQDGTYNIIGVDTANFRVYVKETIPTVTTITGTGSVIFPSTKEEQTITGDTSVLTANDYILPFNKSAVFDLPEVYQDYICQYATIAALTELKEPITDEQTKLLRYAQIIESEPTNRKGQIVYQVRRTDGRTV